jgi:hypothetical protein
VTEHSQQGDGLYLSEGYAQGSGYGWAVAEIPDTDKVGVLLVNEEGEPLVELRRFGKAAQGKPLEDFTASIQTALEDGKGPRLQEIFEAGADA